MLVFLFFSSIAALSSSVDGHIPVNNSFQCEELISCIVNPLSTLELGVWVVRESKEFGLEVRGKIVEEICVELFMLCHSHVLGFYRDG